MCRNIRCDVFFAFTGFMGWELNMTNIDRGACLHKRQAKVLSDHINVWLDHVIIDAICSILLSLQIRSLLLSSMSCSSVQQLRFVKLYDLFCVRLFRARLVPREPLHGTILARLLA